MLQNNKEAPIKGNKILFGAVTLPQMCANV